jgi:hypothetical protein
MHVAKYSVDSVIEEKTIFNCRYGVMSTLSHDVILHLNPSLSPGQV